MRLVQLDRPRIERLLGLLDERLRRRGVSGSVYVIGGAAIAVTVYDARRTLDVDVLVSDPVILEEARLLAEDEGVPPTWLNDNARPWVPPRPPGAEAHPKEPGLIVHWAPPEHLLAMKLIAMRPQDAPDIVALVERLELGTDPADYADLLEQVYGREGILSLLLGVHDDAARDEALNRGDIAISLVRRTKD